MYPWSGCYSSCQVSVRLWQSELPDAEVRWRDLEGSGAMGDGYGYGLGLPPTQ